MGLLDFIKDTASSVVHKAEDIFNSAENKVESLAKTLYNDSKSAVSSVHDDIVSGVAGGANYLQHQSDKLLDTGKDVINHVADDVDETVTKTASSLSMPLLLLGGAAAFYFLTKK